MTTENTTIPGYILEGNTYSDRERLTMLHDCMRSVRDSALADAERRYGLAANGSVRMLDVGSGEGLYLFDLVREKRFPHFEGWGIDRDAEAIETAYTFARLSDLPNLYFAAHDVTQPFEAVSGLFGNDGTQRFDLTMSVYVLMHLRDHVKTISYMYDALKPGGVLISIDAPATMAAWEYPHPSFVALFGAALTLIAMGSGGVSVADTHVELLRNAGFTDVESHHQTLPFGGQTPLGKTLLESTILGLENTRPAVVDRFKMMSAEEFDGHLQRLRREATPQMLGTAHMNVAIARKPM